MQRINNTFETTLKTTSDNTKERIPQAQE